MTAIQEYLVRNQIWVALCGTLYAFFLMDTPQDFWGKCSLFLFIFSQLFFSYRWVTLNQLDKTHLYQFLVYGVLSGILLYFGNWTSQIDILSLLACGILSALYHPPIFKDKALRNIPFLKVFYVGLVWALFMNAFEVFIWERFLSVFFFITALIITFDIRDIHTDRFPTFANTYGSNAAKGISLLLLAASGIWGSYVFSHGENISNWLCLCISVLLVFAAHSKRPKLYYGFWMEACMALPFLFQQIISTFAE